MKLDNTGQKQWDKTLHAAGYDTPTSVVQSADGGYLIGGYSYSDTSVFKSEPWRGDKDYWIVKLTATGQKQGDKTFGGNDSDYLQNIGKTLDGGYILAVSSKSSGSNEKSEPERGGFDFWLIKVDAQGKKQWDKTIGGLGTEYMGGVVVPPTGGYVIAGTSQSNQSFDKSDNSRGFFDYWLVKLKQNGLNLSSASWQQQPNFSSPTLNTAICRNTLKTTVPDGRPARA